MLCIKNLLPCLLLEHARMLFGCGKPAANTYTCCCEVVGGEGSVYSGKIALTSAGPLSETQQKPPEGREGMAHGQKRSLSTQEKLLAWLLDGFINSFKGLHSEELPIFFHSLHSYTKI